MSRNDQSGLIQNYVQVYPERSYDKHGDYRRPHLTTVATVDNPAADHPASTSSSVVAWFVVACLRSPLSFEMLKTFRRSSATDIPVFRSGRSVVAWLYVVVTICRYSRRYLQLVAQCRRGDAPRKLYVN